jgi:hypothetical protein
MFNMSTCSSLSSNALGSNQKAVVISQGSSLVRGTWDSVLDSSTVLVSSEVVSVQSKVDQTTDLVFELNPR